MNKSQHPSDQPSEREPISRRDFIQAVAAGGAALSLSGFAFAQTPAAPSTQSQGTPPTTPRPKDEPELNIAIIGAGQQGRVLIDSCRGIPGLRFQAVCDIWPYSQQFGAGKLRAYGHKDVRTYQDYRDMLDKEKGLHAVLVATPDWMHAEHTIACMEAGLHVYCETDMARTLEEAKLMALTAREKRRLLQIGRQRRSNPRYQFALEKIVRGNYLLGRLAEVNAQWNRALSPDFQFPKKYELAPEILKQYGYRSMHEFLNWRNYRKYGNGPFASLAGHQIDVMNWFLGAFPTTMTAIGGSEPYIGHECPDNVMCLLEYETKTGTVRAFYQVLKNNSFLGYRETFMGHQGSLVMSEMPSATWVQNEAVASPWDPYLKTGVLKLPPKGTLMAQEGYPTSVILDPRESPPSSRVWLLPVELHKTYHQPHLENFFDAIRHGTPLACPGETGYATTVVIAAIERAVAGNTKIDFKPEDFVVATDAKATAR